MKGVWVRHQHAFIDGRRLLYGEAAVAQTSLPPFQWCISVLVRCTAFAYRQSNNPAQTNKLNQRNFKAHCHMIVAMSRVWNPTLRILPCISLPSKCGWNGLPTTIVLRALDGLGCIQHGHATYIGDALQVAMYYAISSVSHWPCGEASMDAFDTERPSPLFEELRDVFVGCPTGLFMWLQRDHVCPSLGAVTYNSST